MYEYQLDPNTEITAEVIEDAIKFNEEHRPHYDKLDHYYIGDQAIFKRKKADTQVNNRVMINHAKYIVDTNTGYLLGNPVSYTISDEVDIDPVLNTYKRQTIDNLDVELAKDAGIFGRAYEYIYIDENIQPRSVLLDARNTIVAYDNTIQHHKLFAINYRPVFNKPTDSRPHHYDLMLITKSSIFNYVLNSGKTAVVTLLNEREHFFGEVPVVEYFNNGEIQGDFEPVISLIDAYNLVQSDRINDREQLVDSILCFYNMRFDGEQMDNLRIHRALSGIPADGKVEYLTKAVNEADADVLRKNLENDIHKISMVPNMSDENFVGNSSGVAIRYKLLAFEQNIKNKERYFEKALMERFKIYMNYLMNIREITDEIKIEDVDAVFTRNLPSNDYETSQMINNLIGIVPKETLAAQLSFVKDPADAVEKAELEQESGLNGLANNYADNEITDRNVTPAKTEENEPKDESAEESENESEEISKDESKEDQTEEKPDEGQDETEESEEDEEKEDEEDEEKSKKLNRDK